EAATGMRFLGAGEDDGFERAFEPRPLRFPADHGSHPTFRTEWWYFTGNLRADDGRHFGFEVTFFRLALAPREPQSDSAWAARHAWMAHLAITDTARGRFFASERFARQALGLAGAQAEPFKVWVEGWSATQAADPGGGFAVRLEAADGDAALDLELVSAKPPVLQGEDGWDAKGPEPGNASYYYSLTRLEARGRLSVGGERFDVAGLAWMDREWSTSSLSAGVEGWDWLSLQLSDGRELMLYQLRETDGSPSPFSSGSVVGADGTSRTLGADEFALQPLDYWVSESSGVRYPVAWRVEVPGERLSLHVEPHLPNQELDLSVRYWEGAVRVTGRSGEREVTGDGYLELAGYRPPGRPR
ncbi:MAG TPA: lipocalin-like domain-containing protein, partial [Burkholderiales bacterium]